MGGEVGAQDSADSLPVAVRFGHPDCQSHAERVDHARTDLINNERGAPGD
jgi:hypothetical protein